MNKKMIKTIVSITCGLGIICSVPFISTSCGSSEKIPEVLEISYTDNASKDFGYISRNSDAVFHTVISEGKIIANFSLKRATWYYDVTCETDTSIASEWEEWLSFSIDNETNKIAATALNNPKAGQQVFEFHFSLYAKIGEKTSNSIDGFTLYSQC